MRISISLTAYRKLMAALASTQMEISGFGTIRTLRYADGVYEPFEIKRFKSLPEQRDYGIVFMIDDVWILDKGTSALTEIKPAVAARFLAERQADGTDLSTLKLWWHRHPLSGGWSATDENGIALNPMSSTPESIGWMVSMVWCTESGWNGRFDQLAGSRFTIDIPVTPMNRSQNTELIAQRTVAALGEKTQRVAIASEPPEPKGFSFSTPVQVGKPMTFNQFREQLAEQMALEFFNELNQYALIPDEDAMLEFLVDAYYAVEDTVIKYGNDGERLVQVVDGIAQQWGLDSNMLLGIAIEAWEHEQEQDPLPGFEELLWS